MSDILLLDDDVDLLDILKTEFEEAGYKVASFCKPKEALVAMSHEKYDLVISDIRMPKMDGMAVMLDTRKRLQETPEFVFYTGFTDYTDEELLKAGALHVFKKPLSFDELFSFVENFLAKVS